MELSDEAEDVVVFPVDSRTDWTSVLRLGIVLAFAPPVFCCYDDGTNDSSVYAHTFYSIL